ncbi:hypothetical protein FB451DRAFT_1364398 [Mycena latifolia]|nr:hypothetical protein FB451DRAFT_1364398 [Mycena latifolia]
MDPILLLLLASPSPSPRAPPARAAPRHNPYHQLLRLAPPFMQLQALHPFLLPSLEPARLPMMPRAHGPPSTPLHWRVRARRWYAPRGVLPGWCDSASNASRHRPRHKCALERRELECAADGVNGQAARPLLRQRWVQPPSVASARGVLRVLAGRWRPGPSGPSAVYKETPERPTGMNALAVNWWGIAAGVSGPAPRMGMKRRLLYQRPQEVLVSRVQAVMSEAREGGDGDERFGGGLVDIAPSRERSPSQPALEMKVSRQDRRKRD